MNEDATLEGRDQKARVDAILLCSQRRGGRQAVPEGRFVVDHGLAGDAHAGPGDRQVPLFCVVGRARLAEGPRDGLCFTRFEETVRLAGMDTAELSTGDRLVGEDVTLEISPERKMCFPECAIVAREERCALVGGVRFARVVTGGLLRVGEVLRRIPVGENEGAP